MIIKYKISLATCFGKKILERLKEKRMEKWGKGKREKGKELRNLKLTQHGFWVQFRHMLVTNLKISSE